MTKLPYPDGDILWVEDLLPTEQRDRLRAHRKFFQETIRPAAIDYWNTTQFPDELMPLLAHQGLVPTTDHADGWLFEGLVQMELTRADTSVATTLGIHNGLFIEALRELGSKKQQERFLPEVVNLTKLGAFALTEPDHGSDISRFTETHVVRDGDELVINGRKRWIGNATLPGYTLLWARDLADGHLKGIVIESDRPGFVATKMENKIALRSVHNADIELTNVRVPVDNLLEKATSFSATSSLLMRSRVWVAWQSVGQQLAAFDIARDWVTSRQAFGEPLASRQLVQEQLFRMLGNASMSLSLMVQIARLQDSGRLTMDQASLAKAISTLRMRETVQLGRSLMGGNGLVTDFEMAKVFADAEAIFTYEGTYEINALLVGRAITGIAAIT